MMNALKQKYRILISDQKFSEILTGSSYALVAKVSATGLALISNIIIARLYGPDILGILAVINSFVMLATVVTVFGTNDSILRIIPEHIAKYSIKSAFMVYRKTLYFVAVWSIIIAVLIFLSSDIIATNIFSKPTLSYFLALASIFLIFKSLMDLNTPAVRGLRLIRTFAFMQFMPATSMIVVLVLLTISIDNRNNPIYAQFAAWGFTAIAGVLITDKAFKNRSIAEGAFHVLKIKNILIISFPMFMTNALAYMISETGIIVLGMYRSESEIGYYSVAVKLAHLTTFVLQSINVIAAPKFSELYHQNKIDELFYVAKKSTKLIFWTTTPILLCLIFFGYPILKLIFGSKFIVAYIPMLFLVLGQFINSVSGSTGIFMNMTDNHTTLTIVVAVTAIVNIGLNFLLIPRFGINGAAFAGMVCLILWNVCTLIIIQLKYGRTIGYIPFSKGV